MPWLDELFPPEDSLDLLERRGRKRSAELEIAVLKLPSLSNFSDLDPLEAEPTVQLRWVSPGEELGVPDAVVIPGSKQTLRDLGAIHSSGLGAALQAYSAGGGHVFGICGGMQMLGEELCDPEGLEGGAPSVNNRHAGLGLLPLRTVFTADKMLLQRSSVARWPAGSSALNLEGFELHHGRTATTASETCQPLCLDAELGWVTPISEQGGFVAGTYLHGVFESGPWRRRWLNQLRASKGLPPLSEQQPHHSRQREALLDRLADAFEQHINIEPLLNSSTTG
jgi:adenosylcobyric acid synthase